MNNGKYFDKIKDYGTFLKDEVSVRGRLLYSPYRDESGDECVTVAFEPKGKQTVIGSLFQANPELEDQFKLQHIIDHLEFNFFNKLGKPDAGQGKDNRVFLRNVVACHTASGDTYLAWCYMFYSDKYKLNVAIDNKANARVKFNPKYHNKESYEKKLGHGRNV